MLIASTRFPRFGDFMGYLVRRAAFLAVVIDDDDGARVGVLPVPDEGFERALDVGADLATSQRVGEGDAMPQGSGDALAGGVRVKRAAQQEQVVSRAHVSIFPVISPPGFSQSFR